MKRNIMKKNKGFTLIELLIVIGILAVLAVTLLLALNPAEAQKRTRDTKRLRDAATLQAIINQYLESGAAITACTGSTLTSAAGCNSSTFGTAPQTCQATNWLGINVCPYAQSVPVDPNNGVQRTFITAATFDNTIAQYRAKISGSDYEVNVRLEAESNRAMVTGNDGAVDTGWYEIYSGLATLFTP